MSLALCLILLFVDKLVISTELRGGSEMCCSDLHLTKPFEVPAFLKHIQRRLSEEQDRLNYYLDYTSRKPLIQCVEEHLIQSNVTTVLDKGTLFAFKTLYPFLICKLRFLRSKLYISFWLVNFYSINPPQFVTGLGTLLAENRIDDLSLMFKLFSRVKDAMPMLKTHFSNYVKVCFTVCLSMTITDWKLYLVY